MVGVQDLTDVSEALLIAQSAVDSGWAKVSPEEIDSKQVLAFDLAHSSAELAVANSMLDYGAKGPEEAALTKIFAADAIAAVADRLYGREAEWGVRHDHLRSASPFVAYWRSPEIVASFSSLKIPRHLDETYELVRETFARFGADKIKPQAEHIHRTNSDIGEEIIGGLGELGAFGLSIPEIYGGSAAGGPEDYYAMVIATEELSRASLGAGGSLITRPEILSRALLVGGTEEQKQEWLPDLASGKIMAAVAVTEPDHGSDVAGLRTTATKAEDGNWLINGTKTWCTFAARADVLMLLARTDPDPNARHRGLSMFVVPKERTDGEGFVIEGPHGGRLEGRPIDTIGYRGMHSYELAFTDYKVAAQNLIGLETGEGRGFYFQMAAFENGRLQTAARAVGVMQAAYEAALDYAGDRSVFGAPLSSYQLTQAKLTKMAAIIAGARHYSYQVGEMLAKDDGKMEASLIKAYACGAAEWVTREALQIHGGMGYAEEYEVSRLFVDARVLSIFEGADETLSLKVIARKLASG